MSIERPFSQACENNKSCILEKLQGIVQPEQCVLEIGSGTAQHIRHFASHLPQCRWVPTELRENQRVLEAGLQDHGLQNIMAPQVLDVRDTWPEGDYDGVFSANCLHIMSSASVEQFFSGLGTLLEAGSFLCVYGPFNYQGQFTSDSNARFEQWLKQRNPESGIRDVEWVIKLAEKAGFELQADHEMPANNRFLHWQKKAA